MDSVAIFSGGLDSTTLVYDMLDFGLKPHLLTFDYGQRHVKEIDFAKATATKLGLKHDVINLLGITHLITNSVLTDRAADVPEGHYADENMKLTVVPNRNMMMLSIGAAVCVSNGYNILATGVHAGDHAIYPDCRPEFIQAMEDALFIANEGFIRPEFELSAPFLNKTKTDIAKRAFELNIDITETWSCYNGRDKHCGKCGTCVERIEAIRDAGFEDQTEYEV